MWSFTALHEDTWSCLNPSLANAQFSNNCAELGLANNIFPDAKSMLTYFEYEIIDAASTFENMDACESFSGRVSDWNKDNIVYPKLVWDGDSQNAVPVADLRYTKMHDKAWRMSIDERELDNLITHHIKPLFVMLTRKPLKEIASTYWSLRRRFRAPARGLRHARAVCSGGHDACVSHNERESVPSATIPPRQRT